jgi:hypothetical protein
MEDGLWKKMAVTGLADLAKIGHQHLDPCLFSAFVERWHKETSSFHMLVGEISDTR